MNRDNERGAIVVEATISLTTFMFAIIIILSIVNIAYIQAKFQESAGDTKSEVNGVVGNIAGVFERFALA